MLQMNYSFGAEALPTDDTDPYNFYFFKETRGPLDEYWSLNVSWYWDMNDKVAMVAPTCSGRTGEHRYLMGNFVSILYNTRKYETDPDPYNTTHNARDVLLKNGQYLANLTVFYASRSDTSMSYWEASTTDIVCPVPLW